jgi:hypothetical protein
VQWVNFSQRAFLAQMLTIKKTPIPGLVVDMFSHIPYFFPQATLPKLNTLSKPPLRTINSIPVGHSIPGKHAALHFDVDSL